MSKKEINMDLDDPRAGKIAEVLGNKTCKKILGVLAEEKEMTESEIASELGVPLNTVGYNVKKLVSAGLIEKVGGFLWSVKGKRVHKYKVSNKKIVISPRINVSKILAGFIGVLVVGLVVIALIMQNAGIDKPIIVDDGLKQFNSYSEMKDFVKASSDSDGWFGGILEKGIASTTMDSAGAPQAEGAGASDYSETNIQVEGVDEPDIVKNDGRYIYVVSGNKVVIIDAYPASQMEILSEIEFDESVGNIFINGDKLIVLGAYGETEIKIYDISDRSEPELADEISVDGNYVDARMIGDYVYTVSAKYINSGNPEPPIFYANGVKEEVSATDVYYFDYPDRNYAFTVITAVDISDGDYNGEVYLTGSSRTIYVSEDNIYLSYMKTVDYDDYAEQFASEVALKVLPAQYDDEIEDILDSDDNGYVKMNKMRTVIFDYSASLSGSEKERFDFRLLNLMEEFELDMQKQMERTVVHKISIDEDDIDYEGVGEVPGRVLNQFSMDEHEGYFRIATTTGQLSRSGGGSLNHLYVLDSDLEIVGAVEDLAEGESIYSARFMGDRAYMVTFKKVDPLFVIDLSDPSDPEVLGYLKITGYSDYLHPYDENHIIGIGKETVASETGDFAWYQGVKVSLFDVSDVSNPIEVGKIEIGDRGTDSVALHEHKAVLFDREKGILVLPITLAEIDESQYSGELPDNAYGTQVWKGAYVLDIDLEGISEKGRITHYDESDKICNVNNWNGQEYCYWEGDKDIQRSLYMDDVLYTISNSKVMANDLSDLDFVEEVDWDSGNGRRYPAVDY